MKSESFVNYEVKNEAKPHTHEVTEGTRRPKGVINNRQSYFIRSYPLHQYFDGCIRTVDGDTSGYDNGDKVFDNFSGSLT